MFSYCTNSLIAVPEMAVYMNCDTVLAINLRMFDIGENDEFIFTIKNYDYIDSPCIFMQKFRTSDINVNGEVLFKIPSEVSKQIKPSAFYNFALMVNAFDLREPAIYKKLTENGAIHVKYGAQDVLTKPGVGEESYDIISVRLEHVSDGTVAVPNQYLSGKIISMKLEEVSI